MAAIRGRGVEKVVATLIDMIIGPDPRSKVIKAISIADHLEAWVAGVGTNVDDLLLFNHHHHHVEVAESDWIADSSLTENYCSTTYLLHSYSYSLIHFKQRAQDN